MAFDPYGLLGVNSSASREEIRKSYRALARKYHPDINPSPETAERFKEMGMAFAVLNDDAKRALFDEFGEESMHINFDPDRARHRRRRTAQQASRSPRQGERGAARPRRGTAPPRRGAPPPRRGTAPPGQNTMPPGPSVAPRRDQVPERGPQQGPGRVRSSGPAPAATRRSSDVVAPLEIEFGLSLRGGELHIPSPVGGAMLTVRVPPNVQHGHRIRLVGRGRPGRGGARPGDLYLEVHVARHRYFHLEGDDLVLELPLTVGEAHHGTEVEIPTPEGWLRIRVPGGSCGGERLRLKGKGKLLASGQRGEMYVQLSVRLPSRVGAATRSLDHINQLYTEPIRPALKL